MRIFDRKSGLYIWRDNLGIILGFDAVDGLII